MTSSIPARAALAAATLALAGCGSAVAASASGAPSVARASSAGAVVHLAGSSLGPILVDGSGRTLYLFKADRGSHSVCTGACAAAWPPLLSPSRPRAGHGANPRLLGLTRRSGGARQVTYHGHPLYRFVDDSGPGQTNGEGSRAFGGEWDAVTAAGAAAEPGANRSVTRTTSATVPGY